MSHGMMASYIIAMELREESLTRLLLLDRETVYYIFSRIVYLYSGLVWLLIMLLCNIERALSRDIKNADTVELDTETDKHHGSH